MFNIFIIFRQKLFIESNIAFFLKFIGKKLRFLIFRRYLRVLWIYKPAARYRSICVYKIPATLHEILVVFYMWKTMSNGMLFTDAFFNDKNPDRFVWKENWSILFDIFGWQYHHFSFENLRFIMFIVKFRFLIDKILLKFFKINVLVLRFFYFFFVTGIFSRGIRFSVFNFNFVLYSYIE